MSQRKYFGTDGIRGPIGEPPITPDFILKLGWAAGKVLATQPGQNMVLIGKDTRISGYMFESALEAGLAAAGVDIRLLGPMPTPAIAYLTRTLRASAGIVISASHNGYRDNGLKFFSAEGLKLPDEVETAIESYLDKPLKTVESSKLGKASRIVDAAGRYIEFCKSTFPSHFDLKGLKIVVDCANGASYYVAPNVFRELGADVVEVGVQPDGLNINEGCGSTHPGYLQKMIAFEQADLGIGLDGDGDRLILVDAKGEICDGDEILYIIAHYKKQIGQGLQGVVGTVMSNLGLELALKDLGCNFVRTMVGDRYVIAELMEHGWELGGEPSGHIVCRHFTTTGDGIIAALQVLAAMIAEGKSLGDLRKGLVKLPQSVVNIRLANKDTVLEHETVKKAIREAEKRLGDRGRVLLRPSGTEPLVRLMVEAEDEQVVGSVMSGLTTIVQAAGSTG